MQVVESYFKIPLLYHPNVVPPDQFVLLVSKLDMLGLLLLLYFARKKKKKKKKKIFIKVREEFKNVM